MIIIKNIILSFIQIRHTDDFPSTGTRLVHVIVRDDTPYSFTGKGTFEQIRGPTWWSAAYRTHVNGCRVGVCILYKQVN